MKILVIRLSSIGDIVLVSPVLRCLKRQLKEAEVHLLVKPPFAPIGENNPYVDRTLKYGEPLEEDYDYVVDLQGNARSRRVCRGLKAKRLTFPKRNFAKLLLVLLKREVLPIGHVCERYFRAVAPLGVKNDGEGLDFFHKESPRPVEGDYVVMVVGANHATKTIPLSRLHAMALRASKPVVLIGGRKEAGLLEAFPQPWPANVVNLCGQTSLDESASILQGASLVVAPDTGMMHIATALGAPLCLLWGCTDPRLGFAPYLPKGELTQYVGHSCPLHPCSKLGFERCPLRHYRCMNNHPWNQIYPIL